jgi:hypothetical protein
VLLLQDPRKIKLTKYRHLQCRSGLNYRGIWTPSRRDNDQAGFNHSANLVIIGPITHAQEFFARC